MLALQGKKRVEDIDGKKHAGKQIVIRALWELLTTGKTMLPGNRELSVNGEGWFDIVKWLFDRIEGKPAQAIDLTTGGKMLSALTVNIDGSATD